MAGFGGAVKLTGESDYRKALKNITQDLKEVDSELKVVASQYSKNDKSQEALTAQSEALTKKLEAQAKKIGVLKDNYANMSKAAEDNKAKHAALKAELDSAVKELEKIEQESGKASAEYKMQSAYVAGLTSDYNQSAKAIDSQEQALSKARIEINKAQTDYNNTSKTLASLDAETEETGKDSKQLGDNVKKAGDESSKAAKGGFTVLKGVLANLGAEAVKAIPKALITGITNLSKATVGAVADVGKLGDEIAKNAKKANISATGYQEWSYILERNGSNIEGMKNAMLKLETAAESNNKAFQELGITQDQLKAMSPEETFNATIKALQDIDDEGKRSVIASKLLGKSFGVELGSLLKSSSEDTEALRQKVHELGGVMSDEALNSSERFADSLTNAKTALKGFKNNIVSEFLPAVTKGLDGFTDIITGKDVDGGLKKISEGVNTLAKQVLAKMPDVLKAGSTIVNSLLVAVSGALPQIAKTLGDLVSQSLPILTQLLKDGLPVIISAVEQTFSALVSALPTVLPVLFGGVKTIISDLCAWLSQEGNVSSLLQGIFELVNELVVQFAQLLPVILPAVFSLISEVADFLTRPENMGLLITSTIEIVKAVCQALINSVPAILKIFENLGLNIVTWIVSVGGKLKDGFTSAVNAVKEKLTSWLADIKAKIETAKSNFFAKITEINTKIVSFVSGILSNISELPKKVVSIGANIATGIWEGLSSKLSYIKNKISEFGSNIISKIKQVFKISSPSKVTKELGGYLAEGLGLGFKSEMQEVNKEINSALPTFDGISAPDTSGLKSTGGFDYFTMVSAFKEALTGVEVELDAQKVGKFVKKTVTNAIYN